MRWLELGTIVAVGLSLWVVWRYIFPKPKVVESMKRVLLSEVILLVQNTTSRKDKLNILHTNMCQGLAGILRMNFDDTLEFDVDLEIPYRPRKEFDALDTLNRSSKVWKSFTKMSLIPKSKKNLRLKAMLESLEPREAALFLQAANKQIKLGISKMLVKKSFPQIFKK